MFLATIKYFQVPKLSLTVCDDISTEARLLRVLKNGSLSNFTIFRLIFKAKVRQPTPGIAIINQHRNEHLSHTYST